MMFLTRGHAVCAERNIYRAVLISLCHIETSIESSGFNYNSCENYCSCSAAYYILPGCDLVLTRMIIGL